MEEEVDRVAQRRGRTEEGLAGLEGGPEEDRDLQVRLSVSMRYRWVKKHRKGEMKSRKPPRRW